MKRRANKKSTSSSSKKTKLEVATENDSNTTTNIVVSTESAPNSKEENQMVDDFNPDLYCVEELIQEFDRVDSEIVELERRRQEVLRILKKHPSTRIKYSTVNRWEKTKEMIAGSQFHNVSADCLGIILSFIYGKELLDVELVKKISSLSTNFNKGLLHYTPFVLTLNREIKSFKEDAIPEFNSLYGIEFAPYSENLKIVELLMKKANYSIEYLSVRCDITNTVFPTFSKQVQESVQVLKYIESHNQTRGKLDLSSFSSLKDVYIAKLRSAAAVITFPSNTLSRLSFSFPHCGSDLKISQLFGVSEHLTLCLPNCAKAANNISDSNAKEHFASSTQSKTKTFTFIRFKSNSKKPDLMERLTTETTFYSRNVRGDAESQDKHSTTSTISDITNKLEKEFNIPLEVVTGIKSTTLLSDRYIEKFTRAILE
ncbi:predicted protein [Naegleria gruberi]|uniref:Predicted protein n=1 Tax=Naegleria gruberi TaxID=5762 RepID=D2VQP1_NAEGR|nr:uncharacterized protein NAEGRDRAFT_71296 [Naegleria gruberi]EFC40905.1 predicted protein [Naegleria gruberi]|eukprot:XP_002673649.1 predicted protein [Naegleria gruberi strain NEG-M]